MLFRTEIKINQGFPKIDYDSKVALFGSCFTENIQHFLSKFQFKQFGNSHGILFHPLAIEKAVEDCILGTTYFEKDLFEFEELWLSFHHHSKFNSQNPKETLEKINLSILEGHQFLKDASHLIITLGTAWVYTFEQNNIVANCHKIPQHKFIKTLLDPSAIEKSLSNIIDKVRNFNPNISIIFTLSPVRHLKDGFIENQRSKSILNCAIHSVCKRKNSNYFPSYEILIDDLRDYRFYKEDMLHPNDTAVKYVWEWFKKTWIDEKIYAEMDEIDGIQKALYHKPFRPNSEQHKKFVVDLERKIELKKEKYPHLKFIKKGSHN